WRCRGSSTRRCSGIVPTRTPCADRGRGPGGASGGNSRLRGPGRAATRAAAGAAPGQARSGSRWGRKLPFWPRFHYPLYFGGGTPVDERSCRERVRWLASQAGLEVFFIAPGELESGSGLGAVFTLEDFDSPLEMLNLECLDDERIRDAVERGRRVLVERCGCEIVHDGAGVFRCLRHDVECDTGEEQDPVIRQTLRWTAACPV